MPPTGGAAFRLEGARENGNAAPTGDRDGADHRKYKKQLGSASVSNKYEVRSAPSTGSKPGPRKKQPKQIVDDRFADETPKQQALHREIARRYSWDDRDKHDRRRPNAQLNRRMRELEALLFERHRGEPMPDDDSSSDYLFIGAHHLAQFGDPHRHISAWARDWAPWLSDAPCTALIERVIRKPRKWGAAALGRALRLTREERKRLKITTIRAFDVSDDDMKANRDASEKERLRARRRKAGAVDRAEWLEANSATRNKPWEALGIGRATYYRRLKDGSLEASEGRSDSVLECETGVHAAELKILLRADLSHGRSGNAPADASGSVSRSGLTTDGTGEHRDRIARGGRGERPAAANTANDRPPSGNTFIGNEEEDRDCFYRERS